jgi:hypothetical protein
MESSPSFWLNRNCESRLDSFIQFADIGRMWLVLLVETSKRQSLSGFL